MNSDELFQKNVNLSLEFSRYLFEHPEIEDKIPRGAQIVLLPEFDEELKDSNLKIARQQRQEGQPVVYVRIKEPLLKKVSQITELELQLTN
jgi:hypothetical protein